MATNKTRIFCRDNSNSATPHGFAAVTEFDVYNEALDYGRIIVNNAGDDDVFRVYLYSYDKTSYLIRKVSGVVAMAEIEFPLS